MKRSKSLILPLILLLSCNNSIIDEGVEKTTIKEIALTAGQKNIVSKQNHFGLDFLNGIVANSAETENTVISPLSINFALGMLANGADGTTQSEIINAIGIHTKDIEELNFLNMKLLEELPKADSKVKISLANSFWADNSFPVKKSYIRSNSDFYDACFRTINLFSDESIIPINSWVKENTNGLIDKLLTTAPCTKWTLINALYFNGSWDGEFTLITAGSLKFNNADGTSGRRAFIGKTAELGYAADGNFDCVALPYSSGTFRMLVLLPKHVKNQLTSSDLESLKSQMSSRIVTVRLPKFEVRFEKDIRSQCINAGMHKAFSSDADFSAMSDEKTSVEKVLHITALKVNEKGTEAAAVTGILAPTAPGPDTPDMTVSFTADRPFYFIIEELSSGNIIFAGKINKL